MHVGGDCGLHYCLGSFPLTFPSPLWFARGPNKKGYGRKSVLAWFDKQTLISLVLLQAPWQVLHTAKTGWLLGLLCCAAQPPSSFKEQFSFLSTASHVYNSNPFSDVCIGVPNCAWSSLYPPTPLLLLLLTPQKEATLPKPSLSGGYWQICLASNIKVPIWFVYSEGKCSHAFVSCC